MTKHGYVTIMYNALTSQNVWIMFGGILMTILMPLVTQLFIASMVIWTFISTIVLIVRFIADAGKFDSSDTYDRMYMDGYEKLYLIYV